MRRHAGAGKHQLHLATDQIGGFLCATLVRNAYDIDAGHRFEELAGDVIGCACRTGCIIKFTGPRLGQRHQLANRLHRQCGMHHQNVRRTVGQRDRHKIAHRIIGRGLNQRPHPQSIVVEQQRVTIRRRLIDELTRNHTAATAIHNDLLAQRRRQTRREQARRHISATTDSGSHHAHRLIRISLGDRSAAHQNRARQQSCCHIKHPDHCHHEVPPPRCRCAGCKASAGVA